MKKKVFYQQSGLYFFFVSVIFIALIVCVAGAIYALSSIFNRKFSLIIFGGLLSAFFGIVLMGFEFVRLVRQVIVLKEKSLYVPDEWGMRDEKVQYSVELAYCEIENIYLRETTRDSRNKQMKRYFLITLPKIYLVLCDKNGKEHAINILYYTRGYRIKVIDAIIYRMRACGNESCIKSGKEIYDEFNKKNL